MTIEAALVKERIAIGQDIELVDATVFCDGTVVILYDQQSNQETMKGLGLPDNIVRRCAVYRRNGEATFSGGSTFLSIRETDTISVSEDWVDPDNPDDADIITGLVINIQPTSEEWHMADDSGEWPGRDR